jgi:hypothetical protein
VLKQWWLQERNANAGEIVFEHAQACAKVWGLESLVVIAYASAS